MDNGVLYFKLSVIKKLKIENTSFYTIKLSLNYKINDHYTCSIQEKKKKRNESKKS